MALNVYTTQGSSELSGDEVALIGRAAGQWGRVTVLVPSFDEREACRQVLARSGVGLGVEVLTPSTWIDGLWALMGDGRRLLRSIERRMLMAHVVSGFSEHELAPLRSNPGTIRLLADLARDLLGVIPAEDAHAEQDWSDAERTVFCVLRRYAAALLERGLIEPCQAAGILASTIVSQVPACARCVILRDVTALPGYLAGLVRASAAAGEVAVLLGREQASLAQAFASDAVVTLGEGPSDDKPPYVGGTATREAAPAFLEVAGPHARDRAYADAIAKLVGDGRSVVVASARPGVLFEQLAERLAVRGIASEATYRVRFADTVVGHQFQALSDIVSRMREAGDDPARAGLWWPAPELSDWMASPLSGADAFAARQFDKKVRQDRSMSPEHVMRLLQSHQSMTESRRKKAGATSPYASVPVVCGGVVNVLWQGRYVSALKGMCSVAAALPPSALGWTDGAARLAVEKAMAAKAIEVMSEAPYALGVTQDLAVDALEMLTVPTTRCAERRLAGQDLSSPASEGDHPVRFMSLAEAALLPRASVDAVFIADVDIDNFGLAHEEGAATTLANKLGAPALELEPAARLRDLFERTCAASRGRVVLARVTHDRQAKDRYPAAIWTELAARQRAQGVQPHVVRVGEGEVVENLDIAGGEGMHTSRVDCLPPQTLGDEAVPYLVLYQRDRSNPEGPLVPRQLSASQIESYASCPLCWFMSSRVRPTSLDAGFGNMEKGNFVHDVMYRFHMELAAANMLRVTSANLADSLDMLRRVFGEVRLEHASNKTSSSAALIPHSAIESAQVDEILPQLEAVVRYEAQALSPFAPKYLEYSFNGLGVTYAGRPLGGRIDRVDVDAEGRAVVIDYKHRSDAAAFGLKDPTVPKRDGTVPADDPDWLPEHTQSLIYAQALRRSSLELDTRAGMYLTTKGAKPALRGAASEELVEVEPGDGRVPGMRSGFPDAEHGGTMTFEQLLDRVEDTIERRLDALEAGDIAAAEKPSTRCAFNHGLGFERRNA